MRLLNHYFLEPINTLTHLFGAVASLFGLVVLLVATWHDPPRMLSMLIYGLSMILLYSSSALLHGVKTHASNRMWLNRLDHLAIFWVIAGTYTPISFNVFPPPYRWGILTTVWAAALIGSAYKLRSSRIHGLLNTSIYLLLGWGSALPLFIAAKLFSLLPFEGFLLLLLGGLIYTLGFVIYYLRWPDPWPGVLGHHEIWHLFVLGGSLSHFLFIFYYVVPYARVTGS
jgi:hemolysin III